MPRKRGTYGEGGYRIRKLADGTEVIERYVYASDGYKVHGRGVTHKAAFARAKLNRDDYERRLKGTPESAKVGTLVEAYESYEATRVLARSSRDKYRSVVNAWGNPVLLTMRGIQTDLTNVRARGLARDDITLAEIPIDQITPKVLHEWYARYRMGIDRGEHREARTVNEARFLLCAVYRHAERLWGTQIRNIATDLVPLKESGRTDDCFDMARIAALLPHAHTIQLRLALTLMSLGMRVDEVLGLTEESILWDESAVRVRWQLGEIDRIRPSRRYPNSTREVALTKPKSPASLRRIKVPTEWMGMMRESLKEAREVSIHCWENGRYETHRFLVNAGKRGGGGYTAYNSMLRWWKILHRLANLKLIRMHDSRVSFISDLADAGVDTATIQHLAGHSRPEITMGVYRRVRRAVADEAALSAAKRLTNAVQSLAASAVTEDAATHAADHQNEDDLG